MNSPSSGIKVLLDANPAIASGGWVTKLSRYTVTPDTQIVIFDTGGATPEVSLLLDYPTVNVQVRGAKDGYAAAWLKINQIKDALLGIQPQVVNGDRWDGILGMGDVNFLQYDDSDRPLFSVNFRMFVEPATNALTHRVSL